MSILTRIKKDLIGYYYLVSEFLVKVWFYLPILWRDRDYDYEYTFLFLKAKLERQKRTAIAAQDIYGTRTVRQLNYALFLLERYLEPKADPQVAARGAAHRERWGEWLDEDFDVSPRMGWENVKNLEEHEIAWEEYLQLYNFIEETRQKYKKRLFKHLEKYIESWWF